jgi:hypothetical protein
LVGVGALEPGVVLLVGGAERGNFVPWEEAFVTVLGLDGNEDKEGVLERGVPEATGDGERSVVVAVATLGFVPNQS